MTYGKAARFYDLFGEKPDVEFYKEQALLSGGKVLELGVGTARLALELARCGVEVVGIDNSPDMLRVARRKLTKEPMHVRRRIVLKRGDIRDLRLTEKFSMIYIPASTFDHLTGVKDQLKVLGCVYRSLEDSGRFVFDVDQFSSSKPPCSWWLERKELNGGREVVRSGFMMSNLRERTSTIHLFFDLYRKGKFIERYYEHGRVAIFTKRELLRILGEMGFKVDAVYGDFNKTKHTRTSPRMVFVVRKCRQRSRRKMTS